MTNFRTLIPVVFTKLAKITESPMPAQKPSDGHGGSQPKNLTKSNLIFLFVL